MKQDFAHMWAFWAYFPVVIGYLTSLFALVAALKRRGVELGFIFDVSASLRILQAIFTNKYVRLADPVIVRLTLLVRILFAASAALLAIAVLTTGLV